MVPYLYREAFDRIDELEGIVFDALDVADRRRGDSLGEECKCTGGEELHRDH